MNRKYTIAIIFTVFLTISAFGQDFDNLMMTRKPLDCSDISYNCGLLFIEYMTENKIDSAQILLSYWEAKCGLREPVYRAKVLLALKTEQFNDSLFFKSQLNQIFNYQNRMDLIKFSTTYQYDSYKPYYGYIPPGGDFDDYTRKLALDLKNSYPEKSIEYVLAEFYSNNYDTIFSKIQSKEYPESILKKEYNIIVEKYKKLPEFHIAGIMGVWIPTGELTRLGIHPELGFQMGVKKRKMNYDCTILLKFLNSPNSYYAKRDKSSDSFELTNHFFGGYIGFDIGGDLYAKKGHEIQLTGGVAWDGFDVLKEDKDNNLKSATVNSFNINLGLGYRYYIKNSIYFGLKVKYNVVDYSLNKIIDFTGNPITAHFIIGRVDNVFRNRNLQTLKYKQRK